jgi:hypothetical protein
MDGSGGGEGNWVGTERVGVNGIRGGDYLYLRK